MVLLAGSGGLWAQTTPTAITLAATTSPAAAQPGVTVVTLVVSSLPAGTITASNLALAVQVASGSTGPSLSATVTSFGTLPPAGGRITFQVNGPNVSVPTPYLVSVSGKTSAGTTFASSKPAAMTVNPPASIVSIVPASGQPGQTLQVTITGQYTNYVQGSTNANFGTGISVGTAAIGQSGIVTVTSATAATVQLTIDPSAAPGPRSVTVASGVQTATASAFTVTAPSASLLSITPNTGAQGQSSLFVSIVGQNTHFANTSTIGLGTGITASNITTTDSTHLAAQLSIGTAAATGTRTLTVSSGSEVIVLANAFTVTPGPAITQVSPNSGQQGQTSLSVAITGQFTHWVQGTSLAAFGAGITVVSLTVNSSTTATAVLNIDPVAALGARALTVTTGAETATLPNAFTVTVSPASAGITVAPGTWNFGNVAVTNSSQKTFTITPTGSGSLTVNSIGIAGAFFTLGNVPSLPLVVPLSGTSFVVTYTPLGTISSTATVTINSSAATSPTLVSLSGTGTPPPLPPAGAITVATDKPVYLRTQPAQISGSLTAAGGAGIANIPVTVQVSINGSTRVLNPYTDAQGNYQTTFQPGATDGGAFSVTASATSGGATRTATATFRIVGLFINPSSLSQDLLMGGTVAVPLDLQNVGDAPLNSVTYSATVTPTGLITTSFAQTLPTLAPGGPVTIPAVLTAAAGNPPASPVTVQVKITATDSISGAVDQETSTLTITLRSAVSTLVLTPPSLSVGANPGGSLTRRFVVSNQGYAPTNNSVVTLADPVTFNWVSLGNANLGNLAAGASQEFQVLINPPASLPLGTYTVVFNVSGGTNPLQGTVTISVTRSTLGAVSFVVSDDTGAKVGGATITLIGQTNNKTFQAVTGADGTALLDGVNAADYTYVVAATLHDPGSGAVTVTASATAQVNVILSYDVVSLTFTVTPTTITDQYTVTLNITYSTTLPKPALKVVPYQLQYSFFPEDVPGGKAPCSLSITNTHPTANVRDISVDASQLDANQPNGLRIHIQFEDSTSVYQIGTLAGKATTTVACYATLDGDSVPSHSAGNLVVQGTYDYTLDGNILQGTTTTNVPVTYTRPPELEYDPLNFTYDQTDPANPVLTYNGTGFVYTVRSERSGKVLNLLKASGLPFGGHNLAAFTQTQGGTTSVDVMNANQGNGFWHTDFSNLKQSLLDTGDTTTYDISTLDNGLTLLQALKAQIAANPGQVLNLPTFLGFQGQWSDRSAPTGYLIPVQITTVQPDGSMLVPLTFSNQTLTGGLQCLNPEDPLCGAQDNLNSFPPSTNQDGQIVIAIDQKLRLERQAFNATLGIGAKAVLSNTVASIQIRDANAQDASSKFFVLLTSDPQGATKGGTVSSVANVSWQLIPNTGAGGTLPQGTQYTVQATVHYVVNGTAKTATTQAVTITVLPSPQLSVSYTVPFVVMAGKDAKIRVSVKNVGYGPAGNLTIQSAQPRIVDTTNPNLLVGFNITGSSNTADSSGLLPGSLTLNFGNVAPGATVSGYWIVRTTRNGFFIDVSSTFTQQDYQGIQLDPVILPPTVTLVPAIGGTVTSDTGPAIPNLTVSVSQNGALIGSDQTDTNGTYYIPDLAPGYYVEQVTDAFGKVWVTKTIGVLGDQGTSLINFVIAGLLTQPVTITSNPSGQSFTLAGTLYTTPQTLQLFAGSTYTINFGSGIPQGTGARFAFSGWSDGSSTNPRTITVQTSPASYSATFGTQYLLSLVPTPPGAGTITATPASPDGYYNAGTQVQLSPAPVTGHRFLAFSGALTGSTTPQSLVVDAPKSVSASFTAPVSIISTHLEPGGVPVNTPTTVQLTVRVTSVNTVIPGSINLISTDATGTPIQVLAPLQPVSTQPDGSYGDYSVSIPVNESSPKTLYFEVSVAARGSLRRVVSAPIPLLVYVIPSDSELNQTVTALGNAATQFSQTRGTLGDTAALNQVSLSLQQQSVVKSVQFSADGATLRVDFNDGSIGLITADRPGNSSSSTSSSLPLQSAASEARLAPQSSSSLESGDSVPTTGSTDVLVLAPQHALWTSSEDPSDAIYGDFSADFSTGRIASLTYLKDSDVTVDKLKQLNQYGVISMTSHGDFFAGIGSYILSGEPVTPAGDRKYDLDLRLGLVVKAFNPDAGGLLGVGGGTYYAITQAFVDYYLWQGFPNSIAYLNSCRSAYDGTLANAFVRRGAGKVFGH